MPPKKTPKSTEETKQVEVAETKKVADQARADRGHLPKALQSGRLPS